MKIIRIEDEVQKSIIYYAEEKQKVVNLPAPLQKRVTQLLKKLGGVKRIEVEDNIRESVLEYAEKNVTANSLGSDLKKEFVAVVGLLRWYVGRHWRSSAPGRIGASLHCTDCEWSRTSGSPDRCENSSCPSHKKWRIVLGPSYKAPSEDRIIAPKKYRPKVTVRKN